MREKIIFRLILTPCCGHMLCWVNPRLPTYCPECGETLLYKLRTEGHHIIESREGWLQLGEPKSRAPIPKPLPGEST